MTLLQELRHPRQPITYRLSAGVERWPVSGATAPVYTVEERWDGATSQRVTPFPTLILAEQYLAASLHSREV